MKIIGLAVLFIGMLIPVAAVARRVLIIRKFNKMFPERNYELRPPLFVTTYDQVLLGEKGEEFITFYNLINRRGFIFAISCFLVCILLAKLAGY